MNHSLSRSAVDAAVAAERLRLADHVAGLTDEQWRTPSLCSAWTVRDVVAHLTTTTRTTVPGLLVAAVRARGDFDRMEIALAAARSAAHTTAELVGQLRESADSTRRFPGSAPLDPLMDLVIHAQDVARPLGTTYVSPPDVVAAALGHVAPMAVKGRGHGVLRNEKTRLEGGCCWADEKGWRAATGCRRRSSA